VAINAEQNVEGGSEKVHRAKEQRVDEAKRINFDVDEGLRAAPPGLITHRKCVAV